MKLLKDDDLWAEDGGDDVVDVAKCVESENCFHIFFRIYMKINLHLKIHVGLRGAFVSFVIDILVNFIKV